MRSANDLVRNPGDNRNVFGKQVFFLHIGYRVEQKPINFLVWKLEQLGNGSLAVTRGPSFFIHQTVRIP